MMNKTTAYSRIVGWEWIMALPHDLCRVIMTTKSDEIGLLGEFGY